MLQRGAIPILRLHGPAAIRLMLSGRHLPVLDQCDAMQSHGWTAPDPRRHAKP